MIHLSRWRASRSVAWVQLARLTLLAAGLAMLGFAGFTLTHAHLYEAEEGRALDRSLGQYRLSQSQPGTAVQGEPIARLEIPSVGLDTLVLEGDDARALRLGAGHIPGTALPGEAGNVGIAGHRDTFFRRLRNIEKGDAITVRTPKSTDNYQVDTLRIVNPDEVGVLRPTADNMLTLVTCYPFHFVGPAPKRFIVRAHQVSPPTIPYKKVKTHLRRSAERE